MTTYIQMTGYATGVFADPEDLRQWLADSLRLHAGEAADILDFLVASNTLDRAYRTGALLESVQKQANVSDAVLARIFFEDGPQVEQWGRVYAEYQEGPPYGTSTYTNEPRHMIADAEEEGADQIAEWAKGVVEDAWDAYNAAHFIVIG